MKCVKCKDTGFYVVWDGSTGNDVIKCDCRQPEELKRCSFCGAKVQRYRGSNFFKTITHKKDCYISSLFGKETIVMNTEGSFKMWNTRVEESE
ncbi:hypothetical protein KAR91_62865 [Candidatus Pacearchaeota archaeon]|nr:hypothetical protein [Candidatus Pacearchaeota archaeon]